MDTVHEKIVYNFRTINPKEFIFDECIDRVNLISTKYNFKDIKLIIYDFFCIECYILGKMYNIPTICSIPVIVDENILN